MELENQCHHVGKIALSDFKKKTGTTSCLPVILAPYLYYSSNSGVEK